LKHFFSPLDFAMADNDVFVNLNDMENDSDFVDVDDDDDDNEPDSDMDEHADDNDDDEAGGGGHEHDEMDDDEEDDDEEDEDDEDDEDDDDDDDDNNLNIHDQGNGGMFIEGGVGEPHLDKDTPRRLSSQADIVRFIVSTLEFLRMINAYAILDRKSTCSFNCLI
jgi:hypothetical protein